MKRAVLLIGLATIAASLIVLALPVAECGSVLAPSGSPTARCEQGLRLRQGSWYVTGLGVLALIVGLTMHNERRAGPPL